VNAPLSLEEIAARARGRDPAAADAAALAAWRRLWDHVIRVALSAPDEPGACQAADIQPEARQAVAIQNEEAGARDQTPPA